MSSTNFRSTLIFASCVVGTFVRCHRHHPCSTPVRAFFIVYVVLLDRVISSATIHIGRASYSYVYVHRTQELILVVLVSYHIEPQKGVNTRPYPLDRTASLSLPYSKSYTYFLGSSGTLRLPLVADRRKCGVAARPTSIGLHRTVPYFFGVSAGTGIDLVVDYFGLPVIIIVSHDDLIIWVVWR